MDFRSPCAMKLGGMEGDCESSPWTTEFSLPIAWRAKEPLGVAKTSKTRKINSGIKLPKLISLGILSLELVSSKKGAGTFVGKNIAYLIITSELPNIKQIQIQCHEILGKLHRESHGQYFRDRAQPKVFLNSSFGIGERHGVFSPWGVTLLFQPGKIFKPWLSLQQVHHKFEMPAIQIHLTYLVPGCCLGLWPVIQQTKMWLGQNPPSKPAQAMFPSDLLLWHSMTWEFHVWGKADLWLAVSQKEEMKRFLLVGGMSMYIILNVHCV